MCRNVHINSQMWNCCFKSLCAVIFTYSSLSSMVVVLVHSPTSSWFSVLSLAYYCQTFVSCQFGRWPVECKCGLNLSFWFYEVKLSSFSHAYEPFTLSLCEMSVNNFCLFFFGCWSFFIEFKRFLIYYGNSCLSIWITNIFFQFAICLLTLWWFIFP